MASSTSSPSTAKRSSLMSRASQLLVLGPRVSEVTPPPDQDVEIVVRTGDCLETMEPVTVRAGESLEAPTVSELPRGVTVTVQFLGEDSRRVKVCSAGGLVGWISLKTRRDQPLVTKCVLRSGDFEVGGVHEVKSIGLTMRSGEPLDTAITAEVGNGTLLKILEIGKLNQRRAKVQAGDLVGWISLSTTDGQYLIGKVEGQGPMVAATPAGATAALMRGSISAVPPQQDESQVVREMLEAARTGNITGVKKLVESSRKSLLGSTPAKVGVNCSDVRGKTALMYASAFGHIHIVNYLLQHPEINVNGTDDMMKTALHHAAKPGGSQGPSAVNSDESSQVIEMLVSAGARLEAKDHNGCTALMLAASHGASNVITCLLALKADLSKRDDRSFTAYDLALQADWPTSVLDCFGDDPPRTAVDTTVDPDEPASEPSPGPQSPPAEEPADGNGYPQTPDSAQAESPKAAPPKKRTTLIRKVKPKAKVGTGGTGEAASPAATGGTGDPGAPEDTGQAEEGDDAGKEDSMETQGASEPVSSMQSQESEAKNSPGAPKAKKKIIVVKKTSTVGRKSTSTPTSPAAPTNPDGPESEPTRSLPGPPEDGRVAAELTAF